MKTCDMPWNTPKIPRFSSFGSGGSVSFAYNGIHSAVNDFDDSTMILPNLPMTIDPNNNISFNGNSNTNTNCNSNSNHIANSNVDTDGNVIHNAYRNNNILNYDNMDISSVPNQFMM